MLNFKDVRYLHKISGSPTNVYFAELNGEDVALKCYVIPVNQEDIELKLKQKEGHFFADYLANIKGLEYERRIYKSITPILRKYSPNIVEYVDSTSCSWKDFIKGIENKDYTYFSAKNMNEKTFGEFSNLHAFYTSYKDIEPRKNSKVVTVVTKRDKNISSLNKVLRSNITKEEVLNILFQIIYNLALLEDFKLIHNDLHTDNILVAIQDQPVKLVYRYDNSLYTVNTKYVIKLFDWDVSYMERLGLNEKLDDDFYRNMGIKNEFTEKFDLFTVLCYINKLCGLYNYSPQCDILSSLIKDKHSGWKKGYLSLDEFWLKSSKDKGFECRARNNIPDSVLDTPKGILRNSSLFDHLKQNTGSIYSILSSYLYTPFKSFYPEDKVYSIPETINWNP